MSPRLRSYRRNRLLVAGLALLVLELLLAALVSLVFLRPGAAGKELGIGDVLTLTKGKHVTAATIRDSDGIVVGEATPGSPVLPKGGRFHAELPSDGSLTPSLTALLAATGADVRVDAQETKRRLRGVLVLAVTGIVLAEALVLVVAAAPRRLEL
jgi:hypothetical protein